jgi:hypothetical protein
VERLPEGFRLTSQALILPDGTEIELCPLPPDNQFAKVFRSACRRPATADEMRRIDCYTVNIGLVGPGGSMAAAVKTMRAGAAIVRAGGAGVFIDNSGLAHGGESWLEMADDGGSDATSYAFVNVVQGRQEVRTVGMRAMGYPDIVMELSDLGGDAEVIIEVIRSICRAGTPIGDGHVLAVASGSRLLMRATDDGPCDSSISMHNPFGRLKLLSIQDAAEQN